MSDDVFKLNQALQRRDEIIEVQRETIAEQAREIQRMKDERHAGAVLWHRRYCWQHMSHLGTALATVGLAEMVERMAEIVSEANDHTLEERRAKEQAMAELNTTIGKAHTLQGEHVKLLAETAAMREALTEIRGMAYDVNELHCKAIVIFANSVLSSDNAGRALLEELAAAKAEIEWRKKAYLDVADAVAPDSESPEHLAAIARDTRRERDAARAELAHERARYSDTLLRAERAEVEQSKACEAFAAVFNEACQTRDAAERRVESILNLLCSECSAVIKHAPPATTHVEERLGPCFECECTTREGYLCDCGCHDEPATPPPNPADLSRDGSTWPEPVFVKKEGE